MCLILVPHQKIRKSTTCPGKRNFGSIGQGTSGGTDLETVVKGGLVSPKPCPLSDPSKHWPVGQVARPHLSGELLDCMQHQHVTSDGGLWFCVLQDRAE